jgi:hypothetical protein
MSACEKVPNQQPNSQGERRPVVDVAQTSIPVVGTSSTLWGQLYRP